MKIFFSGVGGSGLSAIACFMAENGNLLSGSDRAFDKDPRHPLIETLKARGIALHPQDGSGLRGAEMAVFSSAVEAANPDFKAACSAGIPMETRAGRLAGIVSSFDSVAVAGTSGKSTTSGMLAFVMERLGLKPGFIGGGRVKQFEAEANPGNYLAGGSRHLVFEACESDGSIVNYRPLHTMLLNLALDHHPVDKTRRMFGGLIENTKGAVVLNADDENLKGLGRGDEVTFSLDAPSDFRASEVVFKPFGTDFTMKGLRLGIRLPGRHNLYNALSALAMLSVIGVGAADAAAALDEFRGIRRRFDVHLNGPEGLVIDDYAHNPHKIAALMRTVASFGRPVCYIFQPHGYGPTRLMKEEYIEVFAGGLSASDRLIVLPIYYAGGTAAKDISSQDLAEGIRARGKSAEAVGKRDEVFERIGGGDAVVVMGARDESLSALAADIARILKGEPDAPLLTRMCL